jgi:hypothetical protein
VSAAVASFPAQIDLGVKTASGQLRNQLDSQIENSANRLRQSLGLLVTEQVQTELESVTPKVRQSALDAVAEGLRLTDVKIATSVKQATGSLGDQIASAVDQRFAQTNFQGLIANANASLANDLRTEIANSAARTLELSATSVRTLGADLRGEFIRVDRTRGIGAVDVTGLGGARIKRIPGQ